MKISYVIIMCDKDYQNTFEIVKAINKTAKYDYEIFVMDNRDKHKNVIMHYPKAKLIDMGGNKYQFNAKRKAVLEYCTGDYVWFIDSDDMVLDCPTVNDTTSDIICFNYDLSVDVQGIQADVRYNFKEPKVLEGDIHSHYTLENYLKIGVPNWAKLFRLSIAKEFYSMVDNMELHLAEDCLILLYMLYNSKKISLITDKCYKYSISKTSDTGAQQYTNLEPIKRMFTGSRNSGKIVDMFIPKDIQDKTGLSNKMVDDTTFMVFKEYFFKIADSIKQEYINTIGKKYFTESELDNIFKELSEGTPEPQETKK